MRDIDGWLLLRYAESGEERFFTELARKWRYQIVVWALAILHDEQAAEDVGQNVLLTLARKSRYFNGRSQFATWLYAITRNECICTLRQKKRWPLPLNDNFQAEESPAIERDYSELKAAIGRLTRDHRQVVQAVWLDEKHYDQAAVELGIPIGTVRSRLHRAMNLLRQQLVAG
jgi:RNA polymerase sigma-70 factor, ECF subfamily